MRPPSGLFFFPLPFFGPAPNGCRVSAEFHVLRRLLPLVLVPSLAFAGGGIFKYVEKDGTVVYTNVAPKGAAGRQARKVEGEFRPAPTPTTPARVTPMTKKELTEFDEIIEEMAIKYRMPVNLVRAVMHAESAFDPNAISHVGASGLMQLMPQTAREMYVKDIFDARENIEGGTRYLRDLLNQFPGQLELALAAYNAGPGAVQKAGNKIPDYKETRAYVKTVLQLYRSFNPGAIQAMWPLGFTPSPQRGEGWGEGLT